MTVTSQARGRNNREIIYLDARAGKGQKSSGTEPMTTHIYENIIQYKDPDRS